MIFTGLKQRAKMVHKSMEGMDKTTCNPVQGAMYAFPKVRFSEAAQEAAKEAEEEAE